MKNKRFIYWLFLFFGMVSCTNQEVMQMKNIENILDHGDLDSAQVLLKNIEEKSLKSEEAIALYFLLKMKVAYRGKQPMNDIVRFKEKVDYFWQNSRLDLLSDSYYYKGCLDFERNKYVLAFLALKEAERYSEMCGDSVRLGNVQIAIEKCNDALKMYSERNTLCSFLNMQKNIDIQYASNYYDHVFFNVFTIMLIVIMALLWHFHSFCRNKNEIITQKDVEKVEIESEYKKKISQLTIKQRKKETWLNKQKEYAIMELYRKLSEGKKLYTFVKQGGTTALWNKRDFELYIEYYKLISPLFVAELNNDYETLTPQNIVYEILDKEGYSIENIGRILCKSSGAIRTMKSRIKSKKKQGCI